jgi:glycosyltransferase involved in cell wall biosynthesis
MTLGKQDMPESLRPTVLHDNAEVQAAPARRRQRVLIVHNYYQQAGGEDSVVASEKALLLEHGHEVTQYSVDNSGIASFTDKVHAFLGVTYSREARDAFARELSTVRPDIVHVHNFFPLLTTSIYDACQAAGVPVVQTLHNFRIACAGVYLLRDGKLCEKCLGGNPYWGVVHRCYRGSAVGSLAVARMIDANQRRGTWSTKVDCFIALTESAKERFVRAGVPAGRIVVKPNFASDPGELAPAPRHGALFVGRLSPEKGVRELIEAWQAVGYPLRVVGDGPLAAELRARAPANVTFLGRISSSEVRREMTAAAMLIMCSIGLEGFPVVLAEAFALGLPAIVSDFGAPRDIVRHGESGLHVPAGDTKALAQAVTELHQDPVKLESFGKAARQDYLSKYAPSINYDQLLAVYDRVSGP